MKKLKAPPNAPYDVTKHRTNLSDIEVAQAAFDAGFRGDALTKAVAIAIAESHGQTGFANATALNNHGEFSVGMFQINVNGYLSSRLKRWGLTSWIDLWDPTNNAKAAYDISRGGKNFNLWSTYKHGSYLKYMDRASAAANTVSQPKPATGGTTGVPVPNPVRSPNILQPAIIHSNDMMPILLIIGIAGTVITYLLWKQQHGNS